MRYKCECGQVINVPDDYQGYRVGCPKCKKWFKISSPSNADAFEFPDVTKRKKSTDTRQAQQPKISHRRQKTLDNLNKPAVCNNPPTPRNPAPPDNSFFFVMDELSGQEHGPYSIAQIQQMIYDRKLKKKHLVRRSDSTRWNKASDLLGRVFEFVDNKKIQDKAEAKSAEVRKKQHAKEAKARKRQQKALELDASMNAANGLDQTPQSHGSGGVNGTGTLHVTRNTGNFGLLVKIKVLLDGIEKARLGTRQSVSLPIPSGPHKLSVNGGGSFKGNTIQINVGPNSNLSYQVSYTALGGLKLTKIASTNESNDSETSLGDVVEGVSKIVDIIKLFGD